MHKNETTESHFCYYRAMTRKAVAQGTIGKQLRLSRKFVLLMFGLVAAVAIAVGGYYFSYSFIDRALLTAKYGTPVNTDPCPTAGLAGAAHKDETPLSLAPHTEDSGDYAPWGGFDYAVGYERDGIKYTAYGTVSLLGHITETKNLVRTPETTWGCSLE